MTSHRPSLVLTLLTVTATLYLNAPAKADDAAKLKPVRVGVIKVASLTNAWAAKERGIFQKHGLDVTLMEFHTGNDMISANRGGSLDILNSIPGTVMTADERGFDLVAILQSEVSKAQGPDSGAVVVLKEAPYRSLKDLEGKRIAVAAPRSQNTVALQMLLRRSGVDVGKTQFVETPFPSQLDLLKSKQVDAIVSIDPFTTIAISSGAGRVIAWHMAESIPEQPLGAWFATKKYVNDNPAIIGAFNASLKEATDYLLADPQRARAEVVAFTGLAPELVRDMPVIGWSYTVRPEKWQAVVDMIAASNQIKASHKAAEYFAKEIDPYILK